MPIENTIAVLSLTAREQMMQSKVAEVAIWQPLGLWTFFFM